MTWKFDEGFANPMQNIQLQWGHVQNDVEIFGLFMRRSLFDHSFNGATCKMTWK